MHTYWYFHNAADQEVSEELILEVAEVLNQIKMKLRRGCTKEIRQAVLSELKLLGWSDRVKIRAKYALTLTSMKSSIGLCIQTGNMARLYADLIKLQAQYSDEKLKGAIYVVPTKKAASLMGSNMANYERLASELGLYQSFITIPIAVMGFEEERRS